MTLRIAVSYLNLSILVLSQVASASLLLGLMIGGWFALNQITRIALVYNYQPKMRVHFSSIIETLVLPKKKPVGEDSGLIYNLYLVKFLALSIIQLTNS